MAEMLSQMVPVYTVCLQQSVNYKHGLSSQGVHQHGAPDNVNPDYKDDLDMNW